MEGVVDLKSFHYSFLGKDSKFKGEFELTGLTKLASMVEGKIKMDPSSPLVLESSCHFTGEIVCHNLEIFGKVNGKIHATGKVIIRPTAVVNGEIKASNIVVYPGAVLNIDGHTL